MPFPQLTLHVAGHTTHTAAIARRGAPRRPIDFPALFAVVDHPEGYVLFDTGYAPRVRAAMRSGVSRWYGRALPVHVTPGDTAVAQLARRGICASEVQMVVLSHLHADHIGGLLDFPNAQVIVPPHAVRDAAKSRGITQLRRGFVPQLLPLAWSEPGAGVLPGIVDPLSLPTAKVPCLMPLPRGRDVFGDGTVVVVPLPGHAAGHLGMYVATASQEVLLVGDAIWDLRAATHDQLPHPVVRLVTNNWRHYRRTAAALGQVMARHPELLVVPSHDAAAIRNAQRRLGSESS